MPSNEINYHAYEVLVALRRLNNLESRLTRGMTATQNIKMSYSTGASAEAIDAAKQALVDAYAKTIVLTKQATQYLNGAKDQFEATDLASAKFLFALNGY